MRVRLDSYCQLLFLLKADKTEMKKVLFLIHDLGRGGAEKVLVNLVNHLNHSLFEIHVMVLFGGGVNEQFLNSNIHFRQVYKKNIPANSKWMKLFTPKQLHKMYIRDHYDIEISYLEGPCARIISGCEDTSTKLISWIHVEQHTKENASFSFRNYQEALSCYSKFDNIVCVSDFVKRDFQSIFDNALNGITLYNTVESKKILSLSKQSVSEIQNNGIVKLIAVGTLKKSKGYERLFRIVKQLVSKGERVCLFVLGEGANYGSLKKYVDDNSLNENITFLGYQTNPYKFVSKCDLFVCASFSEGFSTAATEALIVGTPVCTVDVSGMKEMLGENNEYGVVTENNEEALYEGIKMLLDNPDLLARYKKQAEIRGKEFSTEKTVKAVEDMLLSL